jgi:hypothetical protein
MLPSKIDLVSLQWAGTAADAQKLIAGHAGDFRSGLHWDIFLLIAYAAGLVLACVLGRRVFCTTAPSRWSVYGIVATLLAAGFNLAQDILLLSGLHTMRGTWLFRLAATASFLKFVALVVVAPIAVGALGTAVTRLVTHPATYRVWTEGLESMNAPRDQSSASPAGLVAYWRRYWKNAKTAFKAGQVGVDDLRRLFDPDCSHSDRPLVIPPPPLEWQQPRGRPFELDRSIPSWWWLNHMKGAGSASHFTQDMSLPWYVRPQGTGICVSGGGVRSATVTLGALQGLRSKLDLDQIDELVSVSGGGYTAGGCQLALTDERGINAVGITGSDVFAPGSVEEDYLRRHSSYLSDGPGQWAVGIAVILRNLLASLLVIGLTVATVGMAIGWFYRNVPIVKGGLGTLTIAPFAADGASAPAYPGIHWPVVFGTAIVTAVAVGLYVVELFWTAITGSRPMPVARIAFATTWAAIIAATIGVAVPTLVWVSSWVTYHVGFSSHPGVALGSISAVVSFIGALAATLWRSKQRVGKLLGAGQRAVKGVLPNSMIQMLIIWIALVVLVLAALLAAGWVATTGLDESFWALAVIIPLALMAALLDQTSFSLHPFYRRRLARAFAVRRGDSGGIPVAKPYGYEEGTPLSKYAGRRPGFPRVTFGASANITGQNRTPPGRRAVSFAFGSEYVGGPQVGWVRTDFLEKVSGNTLGHDVTVESAMAISGAAFASAMGAQTRFYELFLTLANLRLGAWLPNPYFVALKAANQHDWTIPGLPRLRRLDYFAREIFGVHPGTGRMLLCTDGGHYENLGLVELLRRRCSCIYCFDASGESPPLAGTLAQAITLAREELGVEIKLKDPYTLVPGGAEPVGPAQQLAPIEAKLSKSAVITATIHYPRDASGDTPEPGVLIFAQTTLTRDMPYELLQFALPDPGFPNDGTADQWFDIERFDAYKRLGQYLGEQVAEIAP